MLFFIDQPEVLNTINMVQGYLYKDFPVLWIIGGIFILVILAFLILKIRIDILKRNFINIVIFIILIFWCPLFINFFYNNIYDLKENFGLFRQDISSKRIIRYCSMDYHQGLNGEFCDLMPFIRVIKDTIPEGSTIKISSKLGMSPYFYYYDLYNIYNFTHNPFKAEYVVVHYSPDYYYNDNVLYQKMDQFNKLSSNREIGNFSIERRTGTYSVIFKKTVN